MSDTALVFEGGAMRSAFSSAMVQALLEEGISFDWTYGNSASAVHVSTYLSREPELARDYFTVFPGDPLFGGIRPFLHGDGFFNAKYIFGPDARVEDRRMVPDWNAIRSNPGDFRISGFNGQTGETVHWSREDMHGLDDFLLHARASASLPVLMPPTRIGGDAYFDGAFGPTGGIPVDAAREKEGFERLLVIMTRTRSYRKGPSRFTWAVKRMFPQYPALIESMHDRHVRYNRTRDWIFEQERLGRAYIFAPHRMPLGNGTRKLNELAETYEAGLAQAREEMPLIRRFLNLH
ncbi:hypothetical protein Csp1_25440 [Corynebacterium provencense]|uniref:PNPLA domain-containing protein n=1 Tax=Corynebacterium provencense TaxID=1737425 RepID=A0A2Z3YQQ7_9CORY|nr:hypothetical protein Csp1_25440 [Corynebacterium provencense]